MHEDFSDPGKVRRRVFELTSQTYYYLEIFQKYLYFEIFQMY